MAYTKYSLTPANNNAAPPNGAPEGMLPSAVNDTMRDMMAEIRDCGDGIRTGVYTLTAPVITGGSINGTTVGASTASTARFSTLEATGVSTFSAGTVSAPAITTTGDTNTGIFFPAADTIAFTEGGVESMRITSAGNVIIGSSSSFPQRLALVGGIDTTFTNLPSNLCLSNNGTIAAGLGAGINFNANYDNSSSTTYACIAGIRANATSGSEDGALTFGVRGTGAGVAIERMRIDSVGNVGIGTSSPTALLDVLRGNNQTALRLSNPNNNTYSELLFGLGTFSSSTGYASYIRGHNNGNVDFSSFLTFGTSSSSSGSIAERMRITSGGILCVGTTSFQLASNRTASFLGTAGIECVATGTGGEPCVEMWQKATSGNNLFAFFYTESSATARGSISFNRAAGLVQYNTTSDYRAKDIISPVLNSGEVIDSVPVYMGKMKGATQTRPMFIAHETPFYAHTGEKDAVDKDGKPVYQQMDASALVPVLWAEIQSLRKRVAQLESK